MEQKPASMQRTQQAAPATTALDKPARDHQELRKLLTRPDVLEQIKQTLPKHMSPERLTKVMLSAVLNTPALLKVNQLTLLRALGQLSELGLEPGSAMGHVYLIPFENRKQNRWDVNIIIGYRGFIELARRSGTIEQIESHVVFEGEVFELVYGLDDTRKLRHVPDWKGSRDPAKAYAVYAIVRFKGGGSHVEVMSMEEVRTIRNRSQSWKFKPNTGPWQDDFLEMARKTVIRRTAKYMPLSAEAKDAIEMEDGGDTVDGSVVVSKPSVVALPVGADLASQMAAPPDEPEQETVDQAPPHDPVTGEVREPGSDDGDLTPEGNQASSDPEPERGGIPHLLWRVGRANTEQLAELIQEAASLPKDEPRRLEVSKAIAERRKAVRS